MSRPTPADLGITHAEAAATTSILRGIREREEARHAAAKPPAPKTPPAPASLTATPAPAVASRSGRPRATPTPPAPSPRSGVHGRGGRLPVAAEESVTVSRAEWQRIARIIQWADRQHPTPKDKR